MLEFKNMAIRYEKELLSDVSFTLGCGITALLGVNGAGKTTLLRTVLGEVRYTGDILLGGVPLQALTAKERARRVSLLPQHPPSPALSVREVIALGLTPHTTHPTQKEWQTVDEALKKLDLAALSHRSVATLSGGERQKVFFAMQLVQNTPVLLLDEPTAHMDLSYRGRFFELLRTEARAGKAILAVMHDLSEAVSIADRILLLQNGRLAFDGTPARFITDGIAERSFGVLHYTAQRGEETAHFFAPANQ